MGDDMTSWATRTSVLSGIFGIVFASTTPYEAASFELEKFSFATTYCSNFRNAIKLSEDRTILCFDGPITTDRDVAAFYELKENGFFVVRSPGGFTPVGIILSNILFEKRATVVVYDYCLSACANYFLIASLKTYVTKNTVVAWHGGSQKIYCGPGDIERLREYQRNAPTIYGLPVPPPELVCKTGELLQAFFKQRGIDDRHIYEPQTAYTKKMFDMAVAEALNKRRIFWMWHPQNYGDYFKSTVTYESYPSSQDDVDDIINRLQLGVRIFYDPPRM
jgi:hypothetical protein